MKNTTETSALSLLANDAGYDPLERTRFGKGIGTGTGSGN